MNRLPIFLATCALAAAGVLHAQAVPARSSDYLFVSNAGDAPSIWVNPAGLRLASEASLMAEIVLDRSAPEGTRLRQWSVGFSTRGLSFGYQRDRLISDSANQAVRFGVGSPFPRGAIGFAATFYRSDSTSRALDMGIRYFPLPALQLGAVLRNIGRPYVRSARLPVTGVAGVSWALLGHLSLNAESSAAERLGGSGLDFSHRAGATISAGARLPFAALLAVNWDSDFRLQRWTLGVAVGGDRRGIALGTVQRDGGMSELDLLSVTALALNRGQRVLR